MAWSPPSARRGRERGWPATAEPPTAGNGERRPGARPALSNRSRMRLSSKPGQRCARRTITSVRACAPRSTTSSRPPGRSTAPLRPAPPPGPRRSAAHLQHHEIEAESAGAGDTCRPGARRNGQAGPRSRERASASIARLASTPRPALTLGPAPPAAARCRAMSSSRPSPAGAAGPAGRPRRRRRADRGRASRPSRALAPEAFGRVARPFGEGAGGLAAVGGERGVVLGRRSSTARASEPPGVSGGAG